MLVVQSAPDEIPEWLAAALRSHPRILFFPRGAGDVPGTGVRLSGPLPGEWYPMGQIPASPAAPLLTSVDLDRLPPTRSLYAVDPPGRWIILNAHRNRQGDGRPLLVAGERGESRWAVASAAEWWRWAFRGGEARRVYDGALSGVVGWLVEGATTQLASLATVPDPGRPLEWRVRAGVSELSATILDDQGVEVWGRTWTDPDGRVVGPVLDPGRYDIALEAEGPEGRFETQRPVEIVADPRELLPGGSEPPFVAAAVIQDRTVEARVPRPVWPFVIAILLLCAEWIWRHRIGLR
jgi:hypothetical protein